MSEAQEAQIDWSKDGQPGFDEQVVRAAVPDCWRWKNRDTGEETGLLRFGKDPIRAAFGGWDKWKEARQHPEVQAFERAHRPAQPQEASAQQADYERCCGCNGPISQNRSREWVHEDSDQRSCERAFPRPEASAQGEEQDRLNLGAALARAKRINVAIDVAINPTPEGATVKGENGEADYTLQERTLAVLQIAEEFGPHQNLQSLMDADGDSIENVAVYLKMRLNRLSAATAQPPAPLGSGERMAQSSLQAIARGDWYAEDASRKEQQLMAGEILELRQACSLYRPSGEQWIPVSERLPESTANVLVWVPNQTPRGGYCDLASHGEWFCQDEDCKPGDLNYVENNDDGNRRGFGWHREEETHGGEYDYVTVDLNERVTHWMPLPAHPSADTEKPAQQQEER